MLPYLECTSQLCSLSLSFSLRTVRLDVPLHFLTKLTRLSIDKCRPTYSMVSSLHGLTSLCSLSLCNLQLYDEMDPVFWDFYLRNLSTNLVQLTSLDLSGTQFDVRTLLPLQRLPQLKQLIIGRSLSADCLRYLHALPIPSVNININGEASLNDVSSWLSKKGQQLQGLGLYNFGSSVIPPAVVPVLLHATDLKQLTVSGLEVDMAHVAMLTQLTSLELTECGLDDAAVGSLTPLSGLCYLGLKYNLVTGAEGSMEVLARSMPQLTRLDMTPTSAQEAAVQAFGDRVIGWNAADSRFSLGPLPAGGV